MHLGFDNINDQNCAVIGDFFGGGSCFRTPFFIPNWCLLHKGGGLLLFYKGTQNGERGVQSLRPSYFP